MYNVTISRNKVKSHGWQQQLCWQMRGCRGSCVCKREACCRRTGDRGGQEAPADSNSRGSEEDNKKGNKESEGDDGNRATRAMTETSRREEGDNGHNNQLRTKVVAAVRTVVTIYGRQCEMDGSDNQDGQQSR
jgi:hypothetical protein